MAKSPLTNIIGESSAGGFFGNEMKKAGYDHIIIKGKSEVPVFLWINNDNIEIKDASDMWGKGVFYTDSHIKEILNNDQIKVATIGQAGENLVKFASIISEKDHAAGRCGMGAVMGSKHLKAIAVKGTKKVEIHDREKLLQNVKQLNEMVKNSGLATAMHELGTPVHMDNYVSAGDVPIKNFSLSRWKGTKQIGIYAIKNRGEYKMYGCFNCSIACRGDLKYEGNWIGWPEYETLAMMGSNLMVDDLETLIKWNLNINDMGMDTISLGGTLAVFLEALERKLIKMNLEELGFQKEPNSTDQYVIWGATTAIERLIKKVATRDGIGNDLADGVRLFCNKYELPDDLHIHGKGLEIPAHEPRSNNMTALDYATSSRGAYHCFEPFHLSFSAHFKEELGLTERIDPFSKESAVDAVKKIQDACEAYIATGGCIFGFFYTHHITPWVEALNAITGRSYSVKKWVGIGEKLFNLKRKYNMDCGITNEDDKIGTRFSIPIEKGGTKQNVPPLREMLQLYYNFRGWNKVGKPAI
jgi:aldehyde:ferredoxin oxidoreductase